ncbi:hypothetical protein [Paenibacillus chitinolyticus]|uniref:hypothetical protein n=1 Tax=Paenibacillus chitinolyticus TaxID=79263 RepID=UPI0036723DB1
MQSIEMVRVLGLTVLSDPKLANYIQMRDYCENFSCEFASGNVYGIIGECRAGGWALFVFLTGKGRGQNGTLFVNNVLATDLSIFAEYLCYVGAVGISKKYLEAGTGSKTKQPNELSSSRLDRNIEHISNEQ